MPIAANEIPSRIQEVMREAYGKNIPQQVYQMVMGYCRNGPLNQKDIEQDLKNPHSQMKRDVDAFVVKTYLQEHIKTQNHLVELQRQERESLQQLSLREPSTSKHLDFSEKDLKKLEAIPDHNQQLLAEREEYLKELEELYEEYDDLKKKLNTQRTHQRNEFNDAVKESNLSPVYHLTEDKQRKLEDSYKKPDDSLTKIRNREGVRETIQNKANVGNEIKFMSVMTDQAENTNLKPSEIKKLAQSKNKQGKTLFNVFEERAKQIQETNEELKTCEENIQKTENKIQKINEAVIQNHQAFNSTLPRPKITTPSQHSAESKERESEESQRIALKQTSV